MVFAEWIVAHPGIYVFLVILFIGIVLSGIILPIYYHMNNSVPNKHVPVVPAVLKPKTIKHRGCQVTQPDLWTAAVFDTVENLEKSGCTLEHANVLAPTTVEAYAEQEYSSVFDFKGDEIYADLHHSTKHHFINYGDYTRHNHDNDSHACVNEPTGSKCTYLNTKDAIEKGCIDVVGDSLRLKSLYGGSASANRLSARIRTQQSFVYGLFCYRIDTIPDDTTTAAWPAAWMTAPASCPLGGTPGSSGAENVWGKWPFAGEMDTFELILTKTSSSSVHVPCRNMVDAVHVSEAPPVANGPGWYCSYWTPKFLQSFFFSLTEGDKILGNADTLKMKTVAGYNTTIPKASPRCDAKGAIFSGGQGWEGKSLTSVQGCDIQNGMVRIDSSTSGTNDWVRGGGVPKCEQSKKAPQNFSDLNKDKKYNQFLGFNEEAWKAGGMVGIMNIATAMKVETQYNKDPQVLGISRVKVFQIKE